MSIFKSKKITHEHVDLMKWDRLLFSFCRSKDKQKADLPCEEIQISGKIEMEAKAYKVFRSQNAKRSVPKEFRSILEAFRSMQTVQHSCGVVLASGSVLGCFSQFLKQVFVVVSSFCKSDD